MKQRYITYGEIKKEFERVSPELVEAFRKYSVKEIVKATGGEGLMDSDLKPIQKGIKICGPAATLFGRQGDTLMLQVVGDNIQPGDVVVADVQGVDRLAVIGERIAYYIREISGAEGIIIDGTCRDHFGLLDLNIPMFNRDKYDAKLYGAMGPGAINLTIQCGGVVVNPGDLILGDDDGVVVIPREEAAELLQILGGK